MIVGVLPHDAAKRGKAGKYISVDNGGNAAKRHKIKSARIFKIFFCITASVSLQEKTQNLGLYGVLGKGEFTVPARTGDLCASGKTAKVLLKKPVARRTAW
ncbi:hypothetical protein MASR1M90_20590 [Desulfovibrionales bacterium]